MGLDARKSDFCACEQQRRRPVFVSTQSDQRLYWSFVQSIIDFERKKVLLPPLGNFADISYLEENFKPHLLRDICTLCSGELVSDSLLHMLL